MGMNAFYVKDCALASIATGCKAQTLGEFRDVLKIIPAESIYYHFWRQSIETSVVAGSFYNDFSLWAHYKLHDDVLAERLALLDPSEYEDLEKLRLDILHIIENRIEEEEGTVIYYRAEAFHFIRSKIVVFNTTYKMEEPKDLVKTIPAISRTSIFYHFIDARRRGVVGLDDFSTWLLSCPGKFDSLVDKLKQIDPYFIPLADLQQRLSNITCEYFLNEISDQKVPS